MVRNTTGIQTMYILLLFRPPILCLRQVIRVQ